MRINWCIAILLATVTRMSAQSLDEIAALRFSQLTYGNSARTLALGGAFGAVGADVSSTSINPAGLALFRSSEISLSPSFNTYSSTVAYLGNNTSSQAYNLNLGNWGFVHAIKIKNKNSSWRYINWGINTNRLNVYDKQISFSGYNSTNSYSNTWVDQLNSANGGSGVNPSAIGQQFYSTAYLGYQARIINPLANDSMHYSSIINKGSNQSQQNTVTGKLAETNISLSGNYEDKIYFGASIGIPHINYTETKLYSEEDIKNSYPDFKNFNLTDVVRTSGWGVNAKVGAIFRIKDFLRLGLSVQTPTILTLEDLYTDSINSQVSGVHYSQPLQDGKYDYTLITPWRGTASAAVFIKKYGFISLDYEYVPYNTIYYNFNHASSNSDKQYETFINNSISSKYAGASNLRLGAEYTYKDLRFRAGTAYYGTPYSASYKPAGGYDQIRWLYSAGIGFRFKYAYLDFTYAYQMHNSYMQPYVLYNPNNDPARTVPAALVKSNLSTIMVTLGFKI